ncbi:MAG: hypothetical protein ACJ75G_00080 [Gaiellaceae bacterium]
MSDQSVLYLFSSNIRPLYEQDILDVLAAPAGALYQFRYEKRWIEEASREGWLSLPAGTPVLVHFSLQQLARYHDPVLFPIRRGTAKRTFAEGEALFVEFLLGELVCLPEPQKHDGRPDFAAETAKYREYLAQHNVPRPYSVSAGLGHDPFSGADSPLDQQSEQVILFERLTRYLQPTDSFRQARFFRFLRLGARGDNSALTPDADGVFHLEGGKTYTLELFHHQPVDVTTEEPFGVSVDDAIIRVIGRSGFDIGSRYDRIAVALHAVQSEKYEARETVLVIEPAEGVRGPQLRLQLRVEPPSKKLLAGSVGSTLALATLGFATLLPVATVWRALIVAGAAITIAVLSFFGLYVTALASVKLPFTGASSGTPSSPPHGH